MPMPADRLLRPCPFCGADKLLAVVRISTPDISAGYHVECKGCLAGGPIRATAAAAKKAWGLCIPGVRHAT